MGRLHHPGSQTRRRFMARITALVYNWWSLVRPLGRPRSAYRSHHPPSADAPHHRQTDSPCRANALDSHQHSCRSAQGDRSLPPHCGLLQTASGNCGAVNCTRTLVPDPEFRPGEVPPRTAIAPAALSPRPNIAAELLFLGLCILSILSSMLAFR